MYPDKEQNTNHGPEVTKSDTSWQSIRKDIEANITKMLADERIARFYDDEEMKNEAREKLLKNEQYFVEHILEALQQALNEKNKVILLFDVDDTIGKGFSKNYLLEDKLPQEENKFITILRPSIEPLLKLIKQIDVNDRIEIGLCSNRGQEALLQQLKDPENLNPISKHINQNRIYSSRDFLLKHYDVGEIDHAYFKLSNELENDYDGNNIKKLFSNIISPQKIEQDEAGMVVHLANTGNSEKLVFYSDLKKQEENTGIVAVDDFVYPYYFDPNKGIYGVSLYQNGRFNLFL